MWLIKSALINMLKQNNRENIETDDPTFNEEVVVKKETRAITNIKTFIACKQHKMGKQLIKLMLKSKIKNQN